MKRLYHRLLRNYLRIGFWFYFSEVNLEGRKHIPKDGPVIFTANHQNAFLDALLIAAYNQRNNFFLTRASVFRKKWARILLTSLDMTPVYRIRDGWSSLQQNDQIFESCIQTLGQGGSVVIFPEGNHDMRRRLRPLSKGFTRIAFGALDRYPNHNLRIVPVGINYQSHTRIRSKVSVYFGEPILVKGFYDTGDFQASSGALKSIVSERMKRLITDIPQENYEAINSKLEAAGCDFTDPDVANNAIRSNQYECDPVYSEQSGIAAPLKLLWPIAWVINLPAFMVWKMIKRKMKDPVFTGSVKFSLVISVVPLTYLFLGAITSIAFHWSIGVGVLLVGIYSGRILKGR